MFWKIYISGEKQPLKVYAITKIAAESVAHKICYAWNIPCFIVKMEKDPKVINVKSPRK